MTKGDDCAPDNDSEEDLVSGEENDKTGSADQNGTKTNAEKRIEKKRKLREMFNADYDDGKGLSTIESISNGAGPVYKSNICASNLNS